MKNSNMNLFSGNACFSPDVPDVVNHNWVKHGGRIACLPSEKSGADYIFCDGADDPWLSRFYERSMAVFHWSWITAAVQAQFRIPISSYILEPRTEFLHSGAHQMIQPSCSAKDFLKAGRKCDTLEDAAYSRGISRWMDGVPELDLPNMPPSKPTTKPLSVLQHDAEDITLVWEGDHSGDLTTVLGSMSISNVSRSGVAAVAVSDALQCLRHISVEGAVQLVPGSVYLGKEFRCRFT